MTLLGWRINTRRLLISLPADKHITWSGSIDDLLVRGSARESELETLVGRLNQQFVVSSLYYSVSLRVEQLDSSFKSHMPTL